MSASMPNESGESPVIHIYEVGMMSNKLTIAAPDAGSAALYYGLFCVNTNNPFMTAVYTEDGATWPPDQSWWINLTPDEAFLDMALKRLPKNWHEQCRVIEEGQAL